MKSSIATHRGILGCTFGLALYLGSSVGCVPPVPINAGGSGQVPLGGFNGGGGNFNPAEPVDESTNGEPDAPIQQNPFALQVSITNVNVASDGWLRTSDDLIVIGTGVGSGVQYMIPSENDGLARDIGDEETFAISGFAVTGRCIILRNVDGDVFVFNADTDSLIPINPDAFSVAGGAPTDQADFVADAGFVAAVMDLDRTTDDAMFKVITLANDLPNIIALPNNPPPLVSAEALTNSEVQLAIDGAVAQLAVQVDDTIYLYNIAFPQFEPVAFDFSAFNGVSNEKPMWLDSALLMYLAADQSPEGDRLIHVANLSTSITSPVPVGPVGLEDFVLVNGQFGHFAVQSNSDRLANGQVRSVFGRVIFSGPIVDSDAVNNALVTDDRDEGVLGFGQTLAITPDGEFRFLAGADPADQADLLQISKGVGWDLFTDPRSADGAFLQAANVHASDTVCAFQTGDERTVGFILLN